MINLSNGVKQKDVVSFKMDAAILPIPSMSSVVV